jgi:hypothetical protein
VLSGPVESVAGHLFPSFRVEHVVGALENFSYAVAALDFAIPADCASLHIAEDTPSWTTASTGRSGAKTVSIREPGGGLFWFSCCFRGSLTPAV